MKSNGFSRTMVGAAAAAGFCLVQGCSTIHSGGEAEDMRLRPLPGSLEPEPVEAVHPAVRDTVRAPVQEALPRPTLSLARPALTTAYTVKSGDSLTGIAYRYKLRWQDVAAVNPGINPNRLYVDEVIQLPGTVNVAKPVRGSTSSAKHTPIKAGGGSYTVKSGDSLSVIAQRHGVKTADLRKANNLSGDKIVVGQKLSIPGATATAVRQPETPPAPPAPVAPPPAPVVEPPPAPTLDPLELAPPVPPAAAPEAGAVPPAAGDMPVAPAAVPAPAPAAATDAAPPVPPLPAVAPAAPTAGFQNHTVAPGEDLYSVAIRWGVGTADIKAANNLTGSELVPGTVLKIPPAPAP